MIASHSPTLVVHSGYCVDWKSFFDEMVSTPLRSSIHGLDEQAASTQMLLLSITPLFMSAST
jgi:hypothetical protein